jgi:hypothetical protein
MSAEDPTDRGGRDPDPELPELALDTNTPPGSVLPTEANDQVDQLVAHRRSTGVTPLPPPAPLVFGRLPVPSQQGVGGDQEGSPPCPWKESAERSEDGSIRGPIAYPCMNLAFENAHLVPEQHDFDVLVRFGSSGRHNQAEDATHAAVRE